MYECPNCAANLKFDILQQKLHCEYCGTFVDPYDISKEQDAEQQSDEYEVTLFTCPQCGGEILSEDTTAATFCSFCGSSTILDSRVSKERRPSHIIPFSKTKEDCKRAYAKMMKRAIFAPKELKDPEHIRKFRGIYMPYWVYSFESNGPVRLKGSKSYRRGDYIYTSYYDLDSEMQASYQGLTYDASASFADNLSQAIAPFDLRQGKEFTPTYLSGFYADTSDVEQSVYKFDAEEMMVDDAGDRLLRSPGFGKYQITRTSMQNAVRPTKESSTLAMLPVWFLSYRNGDRVSYAVVNGQTGKVAAEIPVEPKKYIIGSILLTIPIFILLNLLFTLKPTFVLGFAIVLGLISLIISNCQISDLKARESMEGDKGLASSQPVKEQIADRIADARAEREQMSEREKKAEQRSSSRKTPYVLKVVIIFIAVSFIWQALSTLILSGIFTSTVTGNGGMVDMIPKIFGIVMVVSIVGTVSVYVRGISKALDSAKYGTSDSDYVSRKPKKKATFKEKFSSNWKQILGIGVAILIMIMNPVQDCFYYIGVILCMSMVIWAFMDIIKRHNQLTTRKLPQFNRRGGEENGH